MTILNVLSAVNRVRDFGALTRIIEDGQRQAEQLARLVDIPAVRRLQEQTLAIAEPMRRLQEKVEAFAEPATRLQQQLREYESSVRLSAKIGPQPSNLPIEQIKLFDPPRQLLDQMDALAGPAKRLQEQLAAFEAPVRQWEAFTRSLNFGWVQDAERLVVPVRAVERHLDRRVAKLLLGRGWLGVERHVSTWELSRVLDIRGRNQAARIDKFICSVFSRNRYARVTAMTKAWWSVPYLNARQTIIRQALRAHRRKEYALSIATLLPLVDGLASEIRRSNPQQVSDANGAGKRGKRRLIAVAEVVALYDPQGLAKDWADVVVEEVTKRMFKDYDFETQSAPAKVNRHGILHGRIADYPSEVNALKTLLMVDVMAHIASCQP